MNTPTFRLIKESEDKLEYQVFINPELNYFDGHFTDFPILPGVVQLHWVLNLLREKKPFKFVGAQSIKYTRPVLPNIDLSIHISWSSDSTVSFKTTSGTQQYSNGKLKVQWL